ncbi:oligopeptide/dipeptide ABC transporter ATP-binding protein [Rhodovulum sp. DZ06]|uniref:oligopeptide/dipeptide ABC transporter ATP-binding protein n=1 Tax=Rhodovulum sp. DZ06 TaxID=3425126 RepID=UPI003D358A17
MSLDHPDPGILLSLEAVSVEHRLPGRRLVHAVTDLSLDLRRGETLGLVGESGCGKSSAARAVMQLPPPTRGRVVLGGAALGALDRAGLRAARARFQMIFQDPIASLNPRRSVQEILCAPLEIARAGDKAARIARAAAMLEKVGLDPADALPRRPYEFSGGQCQRISIARALMTGPELLVCDEAVSALDVSVQAQILNLLEGLKQEFGLSMLFISHDLAVVKHVSDRVAVMHLGMLCEVAGAGEIWRAPLHPYTQLLLSAAPPPDPDAPAPARAARPAERPSALDPPSGCRFRTRCPRASEVCARQVPPLRAVGPGRALACHHPLDG